MSAAPTVSVLVPSWNGRRHLELCLPALVAQDDPGVAWEIVVLDNGSSDGTIAWLAAAYPRIRRIASPVNLGFCAAFDRLIGAAAGEWIALLNNDTRPAPQWLASLVDALARAPRDVAGVAGQIVDWEGERLDFGRGILAFDGHALQLDFRRPLQQARIPESGEEVLVACAGNALLRKSSYLGAGGFDPSYFAYLEDVDLSWRLWAGGERLLFSREAVVRHRSSATSDVFGSARRGFLFERNALATAYKNFEPGLWEQMMPAVWMTLASRLENLLATANAGGQDLRVDPFQTAAGSSEPPPSAESLADKWRRYGPTEFARRGARKALHSVRGRMAGGGGRGGASGRLEVADPRTFEHLRALSIFLAGLDGVERARRAAQARRRVPDREIFRRFPLWIVPTYPGDERLFSGAAFTAALPRDLVFERGRLDEVMELAPASPT